MREVWILLGIALATGAVHADPVSELQTQWAKTRSYQADFEQRIRSPITGIEEDPTSGTLWVVKPGRLRWEDRVAGTTQILNNSEYWQITVNPRRKSRHVDYRPNVSSDVAGTAFQVLIGHAPFREHFHVRLLAQDPQSATLELKPKAAGSANSERLVAKIDKKDYVLRSLKTETPDSVVEIEFKNTVRNPALKARLFEDERPKPAAPKK